MMQAQDTVQGQCSFKPYSQTVSAFLLQVPVQQVVTPARKTNCLRYKAKPPKRGGRLLGC